MNTNKTNKLKRLETSTQRKRRLKKEKEKREEKKAQLCDTDRNRKKNKSKLYMRQYRAKETPEKRTSRLNALRLYMRQVRALESTEEQAARLQQTTNASQDCDQSKISIENSKLVEEMGPPHFLTYYCKEESECDICSPNMEENDNDGIPLPEDRLGTVKEEVLFENVDGMHVNVQEHNKFERTSVPADIFIEHIHVKEEVDDLNIEEFHFEDEEQRTSVSPGIFQGNITIKEEVCDENMEKLPINDEQENNFEKTIVSLDKFQDNMKVKQEYPDTKVDIENHYCYMNESSECKQKSLTENSTAFSS